MDKIDKYKWVLYIDFETRSALDLQTAGAHRYAMHNTTEITLVSFAFNEGDAKVTTEVPDFVRAAIEDKNVLKIAHNAEFDMAIAKYVLCIDITPTDWYDTAYAAAYYGHPRKLSYLANVLHTKSKAAPEEMLYYSKPVVDKKKRGDAIPTDRPFLVFNEMQLVLPEDLCDIFGIKEWRLTWMMTSEMLFGYLQQLEEYKLKFRDTFENNMILANVLQEFERTIKFMQYAVGDVEVMRECRNKMGRLPDIEIFVMQMTFQMNFNGVPFDMRFAINIGALADRYAEDAGAIALEKYGIENLRSIKQVKSALFREGVMLPSLNKKERQGVEHPILELRDQATGAAFSKIATAAGRICPDGRLHGEFVGHGAHTGRWSSRGVQLQNFAHGGDDTSTDLSKVKSYDHLRKHLRLCIHGDGKDFTCADLSQIEARVTAWLANCEWRMRAFENGEDIYARSAEKMFNIPHVDKSMLERQMGKCAELGLGFGGGPAAIDRIAPDFYREQGEGKIIDLVHRWRKANPEICALWYNLERGFREAMKLCVCKIPVAKGVTLPVIYDGSTVMITLPSGRGLYYRGVHLSDYGGLYYLDYSRGSDNPVRTKFWGGVLTENVVQAIARDILVDIMRRIDASYTYQCIGTVHDEVWYLSDNGDETYARLIHEMKKPISWAPGLVTTGDGFSSDRYIK